MADRLLTVDQAAERLGTGTRFIRRLNNERCITVKLGQPVPIPESAMDAYIEARTIEPVRRTRSRYGRAA